MFSGLVKIASSLGVRLLPPRKKIIVMIMGNHSAGKSSFINWWCSFLHCLLHLQMLDIPGYLTWAAPVTWTFLKVLRVTFVYVCWLNPDSTSPVLHSCEMWRCAWQGVSMPVGDFDELCNLICIELLTGQCSSDTRNIWRLMGSSQGQMLPDCTCIVFAVV